MATRTTLNVSLPVELGRFVERLVSAGHYASASEVVRAALRLLQQQGAQSRDARPPTEPIRNEERE